MAPTPEESVVHDREENNTVFRPRSGDEVVISGMSGTFPSSGDVKIFSENLYNKVDMVSQNNPRWESGNPEMPTALGMVEGMNKFDAQFFRVHYKQGCTMEPMSRMLLEHAYGAIYDAGINPEDLRGKKVGVFIGSSFSESEKSVVYETIQRNGFGITGCNKAMYANRISYWIDGKGPSFTLDVGCASSMACLEHAYRIISSGQCDAAIVGGSNLCKHPRVSLNFKRAGFLCTDGKTKCFDKQGDGYVRSDAISVLFLQRAKDAKRIYSEVYHAKANYSLNSKGQFLPIRETEDIKKFFEEFYSEIDVSPKEVEYVEACGSGIAEADGNELEAIGQVFAMDKPVKVGSVKSNMGHSEPASGVCATTKVCLAYEKGQLPANLNYKEPLDHIPSVRDGKIKVLEDNTAFNRGYVALDAFSYTGANIHVLLKGHYKKKDPERYLSSLPYLVLLSGRHEAAVQKIIKILANSPVDAEQITLLHNIHKKEIPGHMSRGYTILNTNEAKDTVVMSENTEYFDGLKRPVWFMYSGMGSQWAKMGIELMRIPIFAAAIEKCRVALEPKGIDIVNILTNPDKTIFDNVLNSFVGIAAVQIGITDILISMGIRPDNIIGHSVGELGCAYADGCFTAEEMILSAYSRGLVSTQTKVIHGSMAAVGLGYKTVLPLCPPDIEVACHNSNESSTISGPADSMKKFVAELSEKGVFAKEVPCSNIPYHSRYIADAGPGLLKYLSEVIKHPKPRSEKWVSTSVPEEKWNEPLAKFSSAEYHTNNLLNSVLFEETAKMIPSNAIVIEISPHGLLQAIVKRSLTECLHVPLTRRGHSDPIKFFLEGIGKLYESGLNPDVSVIYPKIEFPVSTGTPLLSHLVEWEHAEDWPEGAYVNQMRVSTSIRRVVISTHDDDYKFVNDYMRNGATVLPEAAILVMVWETFAMHKGVSCKDLSVIFNDTKFYGEAIFDKEQALKLNIMIHRGNSNFEVSLNNKELITGIIQEKGKNEEKLIFDVDEKDFETTLNTKDIYKIFCQRAHLYKGDFQSIDSCNTSRNRGHIKWTGDWIQFIDSLFQLNSLGHSHEGILTPKLIKKLVIDVEKHGNEELIVHKDGVKCYKAILEDIYDVSRCGGLTINGLVFEKKPIVDEMPDVLTTHTFIPHVFAEILDIDTVLKINLQIVQENIAKNNIKVTELINNFTPPITKILNNVSDKIAEANFDVKTILMEGYDYLGAFTRYLSINQTDLFITNNIIHDDKKMMNLYRLLPNQSFVLSLEQVNSIIQPTYKYFRVITVFNTGKQTVVLMKKAVTRDDNIIYLPITHDVKFSWVPWVISELKKSRKVILVSERQPFCGLLGLVKSLRNEYGNKISLILIDDFHVPVFSPEIIFFQKQLHKDLAFNVLRQGRWGGVFSLPITISTKVHNVTLTHTIPGNLDSLTWVEAPPTGTTNNLVQVCYAGPSFRDAQKAAGKCNADDQTFGMDFSGIDHRGERVMGIIPGGSISSTVEADPNLLWPVPENWSLEEAATVPLPYIHAYYLLIDMFEILEKHTVLVHGGTGALGQALLALCLSTGCTVFTTVSDQHKKRFLMKLFPQLNEDNIGNSRDTSFVPMVLNNTKNKRCHIIINCSGGAIRKATMDCVGPAGVFLDLNDSDMSDNRDFGMFYLNEERNYKAANFSNIFKGNTNVKRLQVALSEGIARGHVRPISSVVYPPPAVSRAFRLLSASRHRGRVLIRMKDLQTDLALEVVPRITYSSTASYLVVCSDDGFGIEVADRLVKRGVRNLMLQVGPRSIDGYLRAKIASWREQGISVKLSSESLQTESDCVSLLREVAKLGPVRGVFISQVTRGERGSKNVTQDELLARFNERALIVANLDSASRNLCKELRHFVVLTHSSPAAVASYVTSAAESLCAQRAAAGHPALYYQLDLLDEFETSIEELNTKQRPQSLRAVLNLLEASLKLGLSNVNSFNLRQQSERDFIGTIARILGVKTIRELPDSLSLSELRLSDVTVEEIITAIKEKTGVSHTAETVTRVTINDLKQMNEPKSALTPKFSSGLGAFYSYIDADECYATEPMIPMPTILGNDIEVESLDPKATYLMLIPGFEGHHQVFSLVCERIKTLAMTFQLGPDIEDDSIPEIAARIMTSMKKRFELKSKFYLMGYSFGVNVALELAALMEKEGHVGIVFCLDSSPDALRVQLDAYLDTAGGGDLQDAIVVHMYHLMTGQDTAQLKEELKKAELWNQKVEACVKLLRDRVHYSTQYKRSNLEIALKRIMMARNYRPNLKLDSQIILMKGIPHPKAESLPEDYNLSRYSRQPVKVYQLATEHATCPQDCRVANIVNAHFEPHLLEEFKNKNICETYLADLMKTF